MMVQIYLIYAKSAHSTTPTSLHFWRQLMDHCFGWSQRSIGGNYIKLVHPQTKTDPLSHVFVSSAPSLSLSGLLPHQFNEPLVNSTWSLIAQYPSRSSFIRAPSVSTQFVQLEMSRHHTFLPLSLIRIRSTRRDVANKIFAMFTFAVLKKCSKLRGKWNNVGNSCSGEKCSTTRRSTIPRSQQLTKTPTNSAVQSKSSNVW